MGEKLQLAKYVSEDPAEEAVMDGVVTIACPYCKEERTIEPDGDYEDIECEGCGKHYRTKGVC